MKYAMIKQEAGLGDIFFLQKAAKTLINNGYKVIWPVQSNFAYLSKYIMHPNLVLVDETTDFEFKEIYLKDEKGLVEYDIDNTPVLWVPFKHGLLNGISSMKSKYPILGLNSNNWQKYFIFNRNKEREMQLKEKFGIKDGEEFIFVNDLFASPPDMIKRPVNVNTNKKIIYNDGSPCHIFDYCWIFENASEIHAIESAFCYIIEVLDTKAKLHMYSRIHRNGHHQHPNFDYVDHIYKKPWTKIQ